MDQFNQRIISRAVLSYKYMSHLWTLFFFQSVRSFVRPSVPIQVNNFGSSYWSRLFFMKLKSNHLETCCVLRYTLIYNKEYMDDYLLKKAIGIERALLDLTVVAPFYEQNDYTSFLDGPICPFK